MTELDRRKVERRADDELRTGEQARPCRFGVEHRAGTDQHVGAVLVGDLFDHADRTRDRHRDLKHVDAAGLDGVDRLHRLVRRRSPHDRHEPESFDLSDYFCFVHKLFAH